MGGFYHVIFDFLEHVVIGHDEFLGRVAVGDVGQDAECLKRRERQRQVTLVLGSWYALRQCSLPRVEGSSPAL